MATDFEKQRKISALIKALDGDNPELALRQAKKELAGLGLSSFRDAIITRYEHEEDLASKIAAGVQDRAANLDKEVEERTKELKAVLEKVLLEEMPTLKQSLSDRTEEVVSYKQKCAAAEKQIAYLQSELLKTPQPQQPLPTMASQSVALALQNEVAALRSKNEDLTRNNQCLSSELTKEKQESADLRQNVTDLKFENEGLRILAGTPLGRDHITFGKVALVSVFALAAVTGFTYRKQVISAAVNCYKSLVPPDAPPKKVDLSGKPDSQPAKLYTRPHRQKKEQVDTGPTEDAKEPANRTEETKSTDHAEVDVIAQGRIPQTETEKAYFLNAPRELYRYLTTSTPFSLFENSHLANDLSIPNTNMSVSVCITDDASARPPAQLRDIYNVYFWPQWPNADEQTKYYGLAEFRIIFVQDKPHIYVNKSNVVINTYDQFVQAYKGSIVPRKPLKSPQTPQYSFSTPVLQP